MQAFASQLTPTQPVHLEARRSDH